MTTANSKDKKLSITYMPVSIAAAAIGAVALVGTICAGGFVFYKKKRATRE